MAAHVASLRAFKAERSADQVRRSLEDLRQAARKEGENVYAVVVDAVKRGVSHGEVVACLAEELGAGQPLIVA